MVARRVLIVFVVPVIFSIIVGSAVLFDVLQQPGRELDMWPMSYSEGTSRSSIEIIGLSKQYAATEPVEIQVKISDPSFSCGDLYITIYSSGKSDVITQGGFFDQCLESGSKIAPVGDIFSKIIDTPGSYEVVVEMVSKQLQNISAKGTFTIK